MGRTPGRRPSKRTRTKGRPWSPQVDRMSPAKLRELMRRCPNCGGDSEFWVRDPLHIIWVPEGFQEGYGELFGMEFICEKEES